MAYYDTPYAKAQPRKFKNRRTPRTPWRAVAWFDGRRIHLGHYPTYEDALAAEVKERQRYIAEWEAAQGRPYPYRNHKQNA